MQNEQAALWELEGDLLQATMAYDKLSKKAVLTEEEQEKLADLEQRKNVLSQRLRKLRMRG